MSTKLPLRGFLRFAGCHNKASAAITSRSLGCCANAAPATCSPLSARSLGSNCGSTGAPSRGGRARCFCTAPPTPAGENPPSAEMHPDPSSSSSKEIPWDADRIIASLWDLHREGDGLAVDMEAAKPFVTAALALARETGNLKDMRKLAECFGDLGLRAPLRDFAAVIAAVVGALPPGLPENPEELDHIVAFLPALGRFNLHALNVFEYCAAIHHHLGPRHLSLYVAEAGKHGLRCRHLLGPAVPTAIAALPNMSQEEMMRCWFGFSRFDRDWQDFFIAARPLVTTIMDQLQIPELLDVQKVASDLQTRPGFVELHATCCARLASKASTLELADAARALAGATFHPRLRMQVYGLVRAIEQVWSNTDDLDKLGTKEVVDAIATFASWGLRPMPLTSRLSSMLVNRQLDLKYLPNPALWVSATGAMARMDHHDCQWPLVALEFASDRQRIEQIHLSQKISAVMALSRLRVFDEHAYTTLAEVIAKDVQTLRDVEEVAPLLRAYAEANCCPDVLFDSVYDLLIDWLDREKLDMSKQSTVASWMMITWCLAFAGYHKKYEAFAAFLDYAFFSPVTGEGQAVFVRKAAQLADIILLETPELAKLVQYPDHLQAARSHPKVRRLLSTDPPQDHELMRQLRLTLQELQWPYEAYAMPDDRSSVYADISLKPKLGENVALMPVGRQDLLRVHSDDDALRHPSGRYVLVQRLLHARGWRCVPVSSFIWKGLTDINQKKAYLEESIKTAQ